MESRMSDEQYKCGHVYPNWLTVDEWNQMSHSDRLEHLGALVILTEEGDVRDAAIMEITYYQAVHDQIADMMGMR